jgi:hypothetical protein
VCDFHDAERPRSPRLLQLLRAAYYAFLIAETRRNRLAPIYYENRQPQALRRPSAGAMAVYTRPPTWNFNAINSDMWRILMTSFPIIILILQALSRVHRGRYASGGLAEDSGCLHRSCFQQTISVNSRSSHSVETGAWEEEDYTSPIQIHRFGQSNGRDTM